MLDLPFDMSAIEQQDLEIAYAKLFPLIARDFLTISDFNIIMATAVAPPPDFKVKYVPSYSGAASLNAAYKTILETGKIAREGLLKALESVQNG